MEDPPKSLAEALRELPDPRRKQRRAHELVPLLLMSVAAMLCGARSLYAIAQWGRERREDVPEMLIALGLKPGQSPSVATLHRVFKRLDIQAFERILSEWFQSLDRSPDPEGEETKRVSVDGKTLRGIHGEEIPGVHLVAAYAVNTGVVLAQASAGGKGTELSAAKQVLSQIPLTGTVVMGDALQTQREICEEIVAKGGTISSR